MKRIISLIRQQPLPVAALAFTVLLCVTALAIAGCGKVSDPTGIATFSPAPTVKAEAKTEAQRLVAKCWPGSVTAQIALARQLAHDTSKHPNGSWAHLLGCMGISEQEKPVFETDVLTAAEQVNWTSKSSRVQFYDGTLPAIVEQVTTGATASPSASAK